MLKDITFGQYFPAKSPLHCMDPRFKLVATLLLIIFLFIADHFLSLSLMAAAVIVLILLSKTPLRLYLRNIKSIFPIILLTSVLNALYVSTGRELFSFWIITVTTGGLLRAAFMAVRIVLLILVSALLSYTTTPTALTDGIESLLKPLRLVGLGNAVHVLAMMMTIALRFIPTLIEETDKIMSAQKARGADMESGGFLKRIRALLPILVPLLISAVRRAMDLAEAMECRCYTGGRGRTRMKQLKLRGLDYAGLCCCALLCAGVLAVRFLL